MHETGERLRLLREKVGLTRYAAAKELLAVRALSGTVKNADKTLKRHEEGSREPSEQILKGWSAVIRRLGYRRTSGKQVAGLIKDIWRVESRAEWVERLAELQHIESFPTRLPSVKGGIFESRGGVMYIPPRTKSFWCAGANLRNVTAGATALPGLLDALSSIPNHRSRFEWVPVPSGDRWESRVYPAEPTFEVVYEDEDLRHFVLEPGSTGWIAERGRGSGFVFLRDGQVNLVLRRDVGLTSPFFLISDTGVNAVRRYFKEGANRGQEA